jgi:hypothetical protein
MPSDRIRLALFGIRDNGRLAQYFVGECRRRNLKPTGAHFTR